MVTTTDKSKPKLSSKEKPVDKKSNKITKTKETSEEVKPKTTSTTTKPILKTSGSKIPTTSTTTTKSKDDTSANKKVKISLENNETKEFHKINKIGDSESIKSQKPKPAVIPQSKPITTPKVTETNNKKINDSKNEKKEKEEDKQTKKATVINITTTTTKENEKDSLKKKDEEKKKEEEKKNSKVKEQIINGFSVVPVHLESSNIKKYLYIKKETGKKWPQNKTLFVCNLPNDCTTLESVRRYFKNDNIESVEFTVHNDKQQNEEEDEDQMDVDDFENWDEKVEKASSGVAHLVFKDSDSLQSFLKKSLNVLIEPVPTIDGFEQMLKNYQQKYVEDYDQLQQSLDKIIMDYDKKVLQQKIQARLNKNQEDDEGFVLVGNSGGKALSVEQIKAREEKKKQKNFYGFQHRQQKKEELDTLRKKFEEDKQRISKMQAGRKFKPY
ncbi:hypothetical protein DLAC_03392 [Tieghemostelium lacteum]|uniref:Ribosomal RNA-processing protein 7 C-terminal domain-containing protein n=1 Tax=Tieghemostelium lacteum TaxID=361077 RepID=A0A152A204_TIELA|nr:hypothetical protein DLAC_03392 [Tieghemostelium lacteum]|eukprot:KYR00234.1 hypothetical protein DLAC_03392 [Tieghemostelium lacteum]